MESERQHRSAEPSAGREEKRGERESDPPAARAMAKVPQGRSAVETRVHRGRDPQVQRGRAESPSQRERERMSVPRRDRLDPEMRVSPICSLRYSLSDAWSGDARAKPSLS